MRTEAVDAVVERMKTLAHDMVYPVGLPHSGEKILGSHHSTPGYDLTDNGKDIKSQLLKDTLLHKHHWHEKISVSFLENKVHAILLEAIRHQDLGTVEARTRELVAYCESFNDEYEVVLPLVGLHMHGQPIQLGRVLFRGYPRKSEENGLVTRSRSMVRANPKYTESNRITYINQLESYLEQFQGRVCSEITVRAEPIRAQEVALEQTRLVLELLRYASLFIRGRRYNSAIGVMGEAPERLSHAMALQVGGHDVVLNTRTANSPFDLTLHQVERMKGVKLFELLDLSAKENRSDFEEILLRAVRWIADAQSQRQDEKALLSLVACLETLFKVEAGAAIISTISEGVAFITKSDPGERKSRKRRVKNFYSLRSKITHGERVVVSASDLDELTSITSELTLLLLQHRHSFATHDDFKAWLEDEKLNGVCKFPEGNPLRPN